jgi:hypothetical protein
MEGTSDRSAIIILVPAARVSIIAAVLVVLLLAGLHLLSPEFDPAWRMVSEYALGGYGWVLSLMFISWAISSWALAYSLRGRVKTAGGKVGLVFLLASGLGEAMAAAFDVKHGLHSVAALIGIPTLPVAAVLISKALARNPTRPAAKKTLFATAALTWVGIISMAAAVIVMFNGLSKAGGQMTPEVIAVSGYANRFLIVSYCAWIVTAAREATRAAGSPPADY